MAALIAILVGLVLFVLLLKVVMGLVALALGLTLAVIVYFTAEKLVGQGR
ncbi:hypothetical protein [Sphingomonas sp.]